MQVIQETHNHFARVKIEAAGGFVGEQDPGIAYQRPGQNHSLLFAAGELACTVRRAIAQAHLL